VAHRRSRVPTSECNRSRVPTSECNLQLCVPSQQTTLNTPSTPTDLTLATFCRGRVGGIENFVQARVRLEATGSPRCEENPKKTGSLNPQFHLLHSSAPSSGRSRVLNPVRRTSVRQPNFQPRPRPGPSGPADPVSTSHPVGRDICTSDGRVKARPSYR
jgi:hypothetical protein